MFRGTLIAQIVATVGAIFLAKLYGEEAYGFLAVFVSLISISSIISTLQLDKCIVISKNENESINWLNFLILLVIFIISFLFLILFFSSNYISYQQNNLIFFLSIVGALFFSLNSLHESFFTFKKQFLIISNSRIFLTISNVTFQIILYYYYNLLGLIYGFLISQLLILLFFFYKNRKFILKPNLKAIKDGVKSNATIIKFLLPSNVINSLANNLMPILIGTFFGVKEAGVYFFSSKILGTPLFLISSSVSQVFFQKSSELFKSNTKELLKLTKKIVRTNLLIMLLFLIIMNTIGMHILEFYFDTNWVNLRLYTLILSILIFARTSFNPISSLIVVLDKNLVGLIFNAYLFIVNLVAIYFGHLYNSIISTIVILAIFGGIGYLVLLAYFLWHLKNISKNNV